MQNNIPQVVVPFCFNSSIQVRWESKSLLAVLYQLVGPSYYQFIKLSPEEIDHIKHCFQRAAVSEDHSVIYKVGEAAAVAYSAVELATAITSLSHHKTNRAAFANHEILAVTFNLLVTGSMDEKLASTQLMSKLADEPGICAVILENHPEILEILSSLSEDDEVADTFKKYASSLLKALLDGVSGILSTHEVDGPEFESTTIEANATLQLKELKRLLVWTSTEMGKSKVLHDAADQDQTEIVLSMIFLASHLREMLHFEGSPFSMHTALQDCPEFLSLLPAFMQRHFISTYVGFTVEYQDINFCTIILRRSSCLCTLQY